MPVALSLLLVLALAPSAVAQASASHRVTVVVPAVEHLAVSGGDVTLAFATPVPGEGFADVVDASTRYALTVNTTGSKITGALDAALPSGVGLAVRLAPPPGAAGLGSVPLAASARDLVADVVPVAARGLPVTYTASADASVLAGALRATRTVTYTVTHQ